MLKIHEYLNYIHTYLFCLFFVLLRRKANTQMSAKIVLHGTNINFKVVQAIKLYTHTVRNHS